MFKTTFFADLRLVIPYLERRRRRDDTKQPKIYFCLTHHYVHLWQSPSSFILLLLHIFKGDFLLVLKTAKSFFCVTVKFCNHIGNDANGWCSTGVPKHFTPLKEIILQPFIGLDMLLATEHHQSQNLIDFYRFLAWRFQTPCKNVINLAADDALKRWLVHRSGSSSWKQSSWTSNKVYSPTHPLLIWQQA